MDFKMIFKEIDHDFEMRMEDIDARIQLQVIESDMSIKVKIDEVVRMTDIDGLEMYDKDYEVTPTVERQSLDTSQKFMTDDVTINAIPIYEVSNTSGGSTVYIGKELE